MQRLRALSRLAIRSQASGAYGAYAARFLVKNRWL